MAQPVWITPAGSLGVIPEGVFFQTEMLADTAPVGNAITCTATSSSTNLITCTSTAGLWAGLNVMFSGNTLFGGVNSTTRYFVLEIVNSTQFSIATMEFDTTPITLTDGSGSMSATFTQHVYFNLQSGTLPSGIQVSDNGLIIGIPKAVASIQGIPLEVASDVTSKFAVRAYTTKPVNGVTILDRIADRTFTITVTGQDAPEFITPPGSIATYFDGIAVNDLQVEYTDVDPGDIVTVRLVSGSLPPGLTIDSKGLISGFIEPIPATDRPQGYSRAKQGFSRYGYDFQVRSINSTFEFVLEVTDGVSSNLRTFSITVYARDSMTADTTNITADNTFITADVTPVRTPILLTPEGSIGTVRSDNFYAFKFDGIDLDGDEIRYDLIVGETVGYDSEPYDLFGYDRGNFSLPPGLSLDPVTGWLYGYIPDQGLTELSFDFAIRVSQADNPDIISDYYYYSITIIGAIDTDVTWLSPSNLGTINTGSVSVFNVEAINSSDIPLAYRLKSGSDSNLPQGLTLLPSGNIAGRVSFNTFALDGNTTTFDVNNRNSSTKTPTTFDRSFSFVVEAYGLAGEIVVSVTKTFTISINRAYDAPYQNLYIQAMPPQSDRDLVNSLLDDTDIIPESSLFRPDDPNFGLAQEVVYWHAYGLTAANYADYVSALYENHYWKNVVLGSIETAQALDDDGNVLYEVVYSRVVDNLVNGQGESVSKQVVLPYPINPGDSTEIDSVFPNSLINMRDQVIDTVGQISNVLPRWMISKQTNGQVLGFTPAWVICYTKPDKAKQIQYNIQQQFGTQLNNVDFEIDRYELDRLLSIHWSTEDQEWFPTPAETTFDRFGRSSGLTYLGEVDFGTDLAFIDINGRTTSYINSLGGIDGLVGGNLNGKTIIFVRQEDYVEPPEAYIPGLITADEAWTRYAEPYDSTGYSADAGPFDEGIVIPGQLAEENDSSVTNERMGIYIISVDSNNIVTLTLLENTVTNDYVTIRGGSKYKTAQLYRPSVPALGYLFINWQPLPSAIANQTIFDGGSLRFIAPVDMYTNTQAYDKYLVFPKRTILG